MTNRKSPDATLPVNQNRITQALRLRGSYLLSEVEARVERVRYVLTRE